jgi:hypothetical protein
MGSLLPHLASITKESFSNENARRAMLMAAYKVVQKLELPFETTVRMSLREPITMSTLKIALDMDVFAIIGSKQKTSSELAQAIGADPLLITRINRVLAASELLREVDIDTYANTDFSKSMIDPNGLRNAFQYFYDLGLPQMARLPSYLKETSYRNPDDYDHPPFEYYMRPDEGCENFWQWLAAHPSANAAFDRFMGALHPKSRPPWTDGVIAERLLNGFDSSRPLIVDVGGGNGQEQAKVSDKLPPQHQNALIIVQDRPEVIEEAKTSTLPSQIRLVAHNFFGTQPDDSRGAKAYYLSFVLHNWPEKQATRILSNIRAAMKPGYSRLYIHESVVAERASDLRSGLATSDINMMAHFAALERTKRQWEELLERVGLKFMEFHERYPGSGIIEVDLI